MKLQESEDITQRPWMIGSRAWTYDIVTGAWGGDFKMRSWVFRFVGWKGTSRTLKN